MRMMIGVDDDKVYPGFFATTVTACISISYVSATNAKEERKRKGFI